MLSMEYLLEEAESNALPVVKKRGILREYLQIIILNSIYRHKGGRRFFFMGGTAMRYFYRMPRFSEDLDFNTPGLTLREFREIMEEVRKDILTAGLSVDVTCDRGKNLFTSDFVFNDVIKKYGISDNRGLRMMIKVEVNKPRWELISESMVLSMYGYNFTAILMSKGNLLSEKICALFNRKRGRDIYDTLFMLKKKFPFNENVLKANKIAAPVKSALLSHFKNIDPKELRRLAEQVRPFLFKEEDIELILKAPLYAENFLGGE